MIAVIGMLLGVFGTIWAEGNANGARDQKITDLQRRADMMDHRWDAAHGDWKP